MANALTRMGQAISKRVAKVFTVPTTDKPKTLAQTGKYLAKQYFLQARDLPPFTFETIRVMLQDPSIKLNLAMRAAPIASVEFAYIEGEGPDGKPKYVSGIKARNPVVAAYVKRQLENIWNSYLPGILVSQNWGWAAGEVTLKLTHAGMIEIDELHPRHAKDCRLLETECTGERWGVQIQGLADVGKLDIPYPYCYFVNYRPENGEKYSASALIGAYSPWADKWLNGGALDTRRLYMHKDAYGGMKIAYPEEDLYVDGNPNAVPARDVAMQIAEQRQAGGTITYPSTVVDGVPKWRIEDATVSSNPAHILQYPKDLDDEMRHGLEIPDGAINNDGSGAWEGKTLPLAAMYAGLDTWVTQILTDLRKTIDPLVEMNFGPGQEYEICHKPLALQAMEQQGEKRQGGPQEEQQDPLAQMQSNQYRMSLDPVEAVGRGVLDAGELVKAARTAIRMSVAPVVDVETEGDDNNERATAIAELLTHLYGDDTESHFDEIFGKTIRMAAAWSAIDHPRGPDGRFIAKNSPEAVASAKDSIRSTLNGRRTAETLKTVTEHLSILSTSQLHDLKREYNVKAGGAKPALIAKIASRIHGTAGSKAEPETEAPKLREDKTPTAPSTKDVHTVPVSSLKTDAKRFQYKVKDIGEDGVTQELKGVSKWNPELAGALLVWRDPENGQDYVVNGHHRHELANRLGAEELNVRYIDAPNAKAARARGALANIAEGRGTAIDAAKYLKDSESTIADLKNAGVSLSGRVANDATILKDLADKPFQMVTEGRLDESKALSVAKHLKDHTLQTKLFKKIEDREEDGKEWSSREIETAAKKMASAGSYTQYGQDLFGDFSEEQSTFDQEVELEASASRLLQQEANDYRAVANKRRADRVADAGNVLAVDENAKRADAAENAVADFERESRLRSPISEQIKINAAEYAEAKTKKQKEAVKEKNASDMRALLNVPKNGDRHPNTGLVWKDNAWAKDAETSITIQESTYKEAQRSFPEKRKDYLKKYGRFDASGQLEGVVLNTDDWREQFSQYVGTNAHEVHEASAFLNNKMYEDGLKELRGKGNKKMLILAGGGGSGKGTATKDHFDLTKYPMVLDQASGNYPKLEKKLDEAIANGFTPEHVFVDRGVSDAMGGVIGRALNALKRGDKPRTVPLAVAMQANIDARKATLELLRKRKDVDTKVVDNTGNGKMKTRLIKDRDEAIQYLENRIGVEEKSFAGLHDQLKLSIAEKLQAGEIPDSVAEGLFDAQFVEDVRNGKFSRQSQVPPNNAG
jgi:hypothetical protein